MMVFFIIDVSTKNQNIQDNVTIQITTYYFERNGRLTFIRKIVAYDIHVPYTDFEFIF